MKKTLHLSLFVALFIMACQSSENKENTGATTATTVTEADNTVYFNTHCATPKPVDFKLALAEDKSLLLSITNSGAEPIVIPPRLLLGYPEDQGLHYIYLDIKTMNGKPFTVSQHTDYQYLPTGVCRTLKSGETATDTISMGYWSNFYPMPETGEFQIQAVYLPDTRGNESRSNTVFFKAGS